MSLGVRLERGRWECGGGEGEGRGGVVEAERVGWRGMEGMSVNGGCDFGSEVQCERNANLESRARKGLCR